MTTVIDHAIAIPTRPATVWEVLKDISNYPNWHPDSKRVQHLTTLRSGRGMRWRNTTKSDKEQVFEITAWYDGLGYEYRIVDGSNYANNRGRIRLQEAPEGTVVQWTFSYETSGFLGGLRNSISMKGAADKEVVQGLRNIYTLIKDAKIEDPIDPEASKAYLKEAPNVEERAAYQPRYPSKVSSQEIPAVEIDDSPFKPIKQSEKPPKPEETAASITIEEPPLTDDDTRPNPIVQTADSVPAQTVDAEPDFLKAMPDPQPTTHGLTADAATTGSPTEDETVATPQPDVNDDETAPVESETAAAVPPGELPAAKDQVPSLKPVKPLTEEQDTDDKRDTSTISVFEVFGLEKPSETEKVRTLPDRTAAILNSDSVPAEKKDDSPLSMGNFMDSAPIIPDVQPDVPAQRRGLRAAIRRRGVKLRVPKSE